MVGTCLGGLCLSEAQADWGSGCRIFCFVRRRSVCAGGLLEGMSCQGLTTEKLLYLPDWGFVGYSGHASMCGIGNSAHASVAGVFPLLHSSRCTSRGPEVAWPFPFLPSFGFRLRASLEAGSRVLWLRDVWLLQQLGQGHSEGWDLLSPTEVTTLKCR